MTTEPPHSNHPSAMRMRPVTLILAALGLILAALLFQYLHHGNGPVRLPAAGNDPCDMVLIGVRPDYSDELYAPDGSFLGFSPCSIIKRPIWNADRLQRDFIFEVPVPNDTLFKIIKPVRIYLNGNPGYSVSPNIKEVKNGSSIYVICSVGLPRLSLTSDSMVAQMRGGEPVRTVDIVARFFSGTPNHSQIRFTAPFHPNQTYPDDNGLGYTLTGQHQRISPDTHQLELTLSAPSSLPLDPYLIIFRTDGTWKKFNPRSSTTSAGTTLQRYRFRDTGLEQLETILVNEPIETRSFRNVVVNTPQRHNRTYAPFLDHLAEAFGLSQADSDQARDLLTQKQWQDLDATVQFLPHGRGKSLNIALNTLFENLSVEQIPASTQQSLRQTAQTWLDTELEPHALALAYWAQWPEFVDAGLKRLSWTPFDRQGEWDWAHAFAFTPHPSDIEIQAVADILANRDLRHRDTRHHLIDFLRHQAPHPAGRAALLSLAQGNCPWVWSHLIQNDELFEQMTAHGPIAELIEQRALALDVIETPCSTSDSATEITQPMATWLTPALAQYDPNEFTRIVQALAQHGDPERDTPLLGRYLREQLRQWSLFRFKSKPTDNYIAIQKVIMLLNQWHHLHLGALGQDLSITWDRSEGFWRDFARSAITWIETRQDPMTLSSDYEIDSNDLRLVWHNTEAPEKSVVILWSPPSLSGERVDCFSWSDDNGFFRCIVHPNAKQDGFKLILKGPADFPATLRAAMVPGELPSPTDLHQIVQTYQDIPTDSVPPYQLVWEWALQDESVLSGTPLYRQWQRAFLHPQTTASPQSRVFNQATIQETNVVQPQAN